MPITISKTEDGVLTYPMHKHKVYEVMLYLSGNGVLRTPEKDYPFVPGTIIIMPPGIEHGSTSDNGFKNISVGGEFDHLMYFEKPCVLTDNDMNEGRTLAELIYLNHYSGEDYLSSLCSAYVRFLLRNISKENTVSHAVNNISRLISENAYDYTVNVTKFLSESGYAEDYIRTCFKEITGMTPNAFLTKVRIDRACNLINIYGDTIPLSGIGERCGYTDYVYFSKKFKQVTGMSPRRYRAMLKQ